jgi:mycobactin lysine-N-oxygenase
MHNSHRKTLAVIGAGPKGLAVAVKAKVLEEFGLPVDRVILIERHSVAAHWSGEAGFTNGEMKLGTSPEKDVVFPVETDVGDAHTNQQIRQRLLDFSWTSYLVQTSGHSDWVDRGRPAPDHQQWAAYLKWVAGQLAPQVVILKAEVEKIHLCLETNQWMLGLKDTTELRADGLMLTGPGKTRGNFNQTEGIYDLQSFWCELTRGSFRPKGSLAIVGAGENAASVLLALTKQLPSVDIDVISPKGFISTRSESYYENQFYSSPEKSGWKNLELADRVDFITRTDLGVFSVHAMAILNGEKNHRILRGRLVDLKSEEGQIHLTLNYGQELSTHTYDQVILATGLDQMATLKAMLTPESISLMEESLDAPLSESEMVKRIQFDLSVDGIGPALYLPMLAGLMQGPGFSNLSCLGLLSDRILLGKEFK